MNTIPALTWHDCYDSSWRGLIMPDAFAHPAKFSRGLCEHIIRHGIEQGWWKPGPPGAADVIGDPFGGVGTGGIIAAYNGLGWIGRELEPKFVALAKQNFALHAEKLCALNHPQPYIEHGDSRRFAEIWHQLDGFVLSPPYADQAIEKSSGSIDIEKNYATYRASGGGSSLEKYSATQARHSCGYGASPGQIASLKSGDLDAVMTSPPYAEGLGRGGGPSYVSLTNEKGIARADYGATIGQIGSLSTGAVDAVVTSPPYAENQRSDRTSEQRDQRRGFRQGKGCFRTSETYGRSAGQIGGEAGETYWQAMRQVYAQCLLALKPRGVMAVVVKDYVKAKQRVPLCDQTLQLLTHLGLEPVCRIHAMLVREHKHECMFNGTVTRRRERKSFFRRLAESKGSPRIDYEEVIVVRKGAA